MDRRLALMDTAEALARSRGLDAFSFADLADAVGIRKPSVHHHFRTKDEMALAILERYIDAFATALAGFERDTKSGAGRVMAYVDVYRQAAECGSKLCLCVAFGTSRESLSDKVLNRLCAFHGASLDWLERAFRDGLADGSIQDVTDPGVEAHACLALVQGAQVMARADGSDVPFNNAVAGLERRLSERRS